MVTTSDRMPLQGVRQHGEEVRQRRYARYYARCCLGAGRNKGSAISGTRGRCKL